MFCDLVGSTALSQRLDPEDLRELMHAYQQTCRDVIAEFDGYIARYMGDGVLAYFGYPRAHELDAERAVRAGLEITARVARIRVGEHPQLSARVGIETGQVVAGDIIGNGEAQEHAVLGDTPNLAARLQGVATAGLVVIGPGTYQLVSSRFGIEGLGQHSLKGINLPVSVYRVDAVREHVRTAPVAPIVGRQQEVELLSERLCSLGQQGSVVVIEGESGMGKTRLLQHALNLVSGRFERAILRCSPFYRDRPLYPVRRHWNNLLEMQGTTDKSQALQQVLEAHGVKDPELFELMRSALLGSDSAGIDAGVGKVVEAVDSRTAQQRRSAMLATLQEVVLQFSRHKPLLLAVEDAHWIDSSTAEFLQCLCQRTEIVNLSVLITSREPLAWMPELGERLLHISLGPLDQQSAQEMVAAVAGSQSLPEHSRAAILQRSGGFPLYIEELTKAVLNSQGHEGATPSVPSSLQDSLRARLDRLGPNKAIAQFLAVLGRHFSHRVIIACSPFAQDECERGLMHLLGAGLLVLTGSGIRQGYAFRHAMVQEVAYESLLKRTRRAHHLLVAERLQQLLPDMAATAPDLLASHFDRGQKFVEAIDCWYHAGQQAAESWAHVEAVNHFTRALERLTSLDDSDSLAERELVLRVELVRSLRVLERGDEGLDQLPPAMAIARRLGYKAELALLQNLRGNLLFSRGDIEGCLLSHEDAIGSARAAGSAVAEIQARSGIGDANLLRGMVATAEQDYDGCLTLCTGTELNRFKPPNLGLRGHMRLYLNRLQESEQDIREAIRLSLSLHDRRTEMVARGSCLAKTLCEQGDYALACTELEQALEFASELHAERFEALYLLFLVRARHGAGWTSDLNCLADRAIHIAEGMGFSYVGAIVFGAKALVASSADERQQALLEGERLLTPSAPSQNYLWFLRDAIETSLLDAQWVQATGYAKRLAQYTRHQPLAWSDLYIDLVASLVNVRQQKPHFSSVITQAALRQRCVDSGAQAALQLFDRVLDATA